jgi:DNA polymerase V
MKEEKKFKAIVDCNSFYCSCERLFRPDLQNKPMVVLSNNDGCIISRTDEAKLLGVQMAGPYFMAKEVIEKNNVATFSSNYNLYGRYEQTRYGYFKNPGRRKKCRSIFR